MDKLPPGSGACCLPRVSGITYIQVGERGDSVGMSNLDTVFQQLFALRRRPEDTSDDELVGMARKYNYIPRQPAIEAEYAVALRRAYALFISRQEQ